MKESVLLEKMPIKRLGQHGQDVLQQEERDKVSVSFRMNFSFNQRF